MNEPLERWTGAMPKPPEQRPREPGPESVLDVPAELREVDDLLARHARRQPLPAGLAGRVFDASVGLLPGRGRRWEPVLRLQPVGARSLWGRLALAASIVLAVFVAGRILPGGVPGPLLSPHLELVLLEYAGAGEEPRNAAVEQLLVTRDMTFRDLACDLANLAADLEM